MIVSAAPVTNDEIENKAEDVGRSIKNTFESAADKTEDAFKSMGNDIKNAYHHTEDWFDKTF